MKIGQLFQRREAGLYEEAPTETVSKRIYDRRVEERDAALQRAINAEYKLALIAEREAAQG